MQKIILVGAGGHAKVIVDTIEQNGIYEIIGFLDFDDIGSEVYRGYKVIGHDEDVQSFYNEGIRNAFVCVGFLKNPNPREKLYNELIKCGYTVPSIIDQSAIMANDVIVGDGTYIGKNAVVNSEATIGKMCIINTGAIIEHECRVGDYTHIAVGSTLCGQVRVGNNSLVGSNATIIQGINIGDECTIGAGAVVIHDVASNQTVVGVPAKMIH